MRMSQKNKKASTLDGIPAELLKYETNKMKKLLKKLSPDTSTMKKLHQASIFLNLVFFRLVIRKLILLFQMSHSNI